MRFGGGRNSTGDSRSSGPTNAVASPACQLRCLNGCARTTSFARGELRTPSERCRPPREGKTLTQVQARARRCLGYDTCNPRGETKWESRNTRLSLSRPSGLHPGARYASCAFGLRREAVVASATRRLAKTPCLMPAPLEGPGSQALSVRFSLLPLLQQVPPALDIP